MEKILKIIFAVLLSLFVYIQICNIFTYPMYNYDDALFASVSKNLAFGYGYSSSLNNSSLINFHSGIGTGPTMILPLALAVKFCGNQYYLPGLVPAFFNLVLIILILLIIKHKIKNSLVLWIWRNVFITFILVVSSFAGLELWQQFNQFYSSMFGEATSVLLIILGSLILFRLDYKNNSRVFFISLLFGLAVQAKWISLLPVIAILFYIITIKLRNKENKKSVLLFIVYYLSGICMPVFLFNIYKLLALMSFTSFIDSIINEYHFIINTSISDTVCFRDKVFLNIYKLTDSLGTVRFILMVCFTIYSFCSFFLRAKETDAKYILFHSTLFSFSVLFLWYIFLMSSNGYLRYFFIAWILFIVSISFDIFLADTRNKKILTAFIIFIVVITSFNNIYINNLRKFEFNLSKRKYVESLFQVKNFIISNSKNTYYGDGWWIPWELDFLLPGVNNFKNIKYDQSFCKNKIIIINKRFCNNNGEYIFLKNVLENEYYILYEIV